MKFNVIIPAAGLATRLRPLTNEHASKAMIRVLGKPCIEYILEELSDAAKIIIVDNGKNRDIRNHIVKRHPNDSRIIFAVQPEPVGPLDAVACGARIIPPELCDLPLVVWLGDAIIKPKEKLPLGSDFLLTKEVSDHHRWCIWNSDTNTFYDKPDATPDSNHALVGLYSFSNGLIAQRAIRARAFDISSALSRYLQMTKLNFENVPIEDYWYDIGSLDRYHDTCARLLSRKARTFHSFQYNSELGLLKKTSTWDTCEKENNWYKSLSPEESIFVPRWFESPNPRQELILSYEPGVLLSDLMLHENISRSTWDYIISSLMNIRNKYFCRYDHLQTLDSKEHWYSRARVRLAKIPELTYSEKEVIVNYIRNNILTSVRPITCMHGDLHFGNILYDVATGRFRFIDPRGQYGFQLTKAGDDLYDMAKLAHDLYWGYNAIVADTKLNNDCKEIFSEKIDHCDVIINAGLILLATCIPLHYDDRPRQERILAVVKSNLHRLT